MNWIWENWWSLVIAALCLSAAVRFSVDLVIANKRVRRATYRRAYRRGIVYGYKKRAEFEVRRRQADLHAAGRHHDVRPDAGPPATVRRIKFHSGP